MYSTTVVISIYISANGVLQHCSRYDCGLRLVPRVRCIFYSRYRQRKCSVVDVRENELKALKPESRRTSQPNGVKYRYYTRTFDDTADSSNMPRYRGELDFFFRATIAAHGSQPGLYTAVIQVRRLSAVPKFPYDTFRAVCKLSLIFIGEGGLTSILGPSPSPSPTRPPLPFHTENRLVLDLSCRRRPGGEERGDFLVVTDKWQKFTRFAVTRANLERLAAYCDEFLVHGVDAEVGWQVGYSRGCGFRKSMHGFLSCCLCVSALHVCRGVRDVCTNSFCV